MKELILAGLLLAFLCVGTVCYAVFEGLNRLMAYAVQIGFIDSKSIVYIILKFSKDMAVILFIFATLYLFVKALFEVLWNK